MTYLDTSMGRQLRAAIAVMILATGLAGCGAGKKPKAVSAGSAAPKPVEDAAWGMERVKQAIALLNQGNAVAARTELLRALNAQPGDTIARSLLKQIDTDPKLLLGTENYSYTLKDDDTMSRLAQQHLGDPLMAYALARYNGLASPLQIQAGQKILIPGKRKPATTVAKKSPAPAKKPAATAASSAPSAAKPTQTVNPAQAAKLRGQGLAAMNAGAINRAVVLLRQALAYDPGNGLIRGDLGRALRIQNTLKARP